MLDLGSASFRLEGPEFGRERLAAYAEDLFGEFDRRLEIGLRLPDYAIRLELEQGSLKIKVGVLARLTVLYLGIANYGSFRDGLREIHSDLQTVQADFARAAAASARVKRDPVIRRNAGTIGKLERLFLRVQRQELSPEEATRQAIELLGREDAVPPNFETELRRAMASCPRDPIQIRLPYPEEDEPADQELPEPRRPRKEPPIADRRRYRIEMSRESKTGELSVSITLV